MYHIKNIKLFFIILFLLIIVVSQPSHAAKKNVWYVDSSSSTGPMAVVHVDNINSQKIAFAVIYEYERTCDPIFSMFIFNKNKIDLGQNIFKKVVEPNNYFLTINGYRYTWHSVQAKYENGYELAIGVTNETWEMLANNPSSLTFSEGTKNVYKVPTRNINNSIIEAFNICKKRFIK
jgi:hypothetical protein